MRTTTLKLLEVTLQGLPPTVNQMYRNAGTAHRYKTQKTREYQKYAVEAMKDAHLVSYTFLGRAILDVKFYASDKRKWDMDNRFKALQDCLMMAGIIADDSQIRKITAERIDTSDEPTTTVTVFSILELPE